MKSPTRSTSATDISNSPGTSTGSKSSASALICYLLLASVYLLYWPHADFISDDWFQLHFYRQHQANGWTGQMEVARTLIQNKLYSVFQISWLSHLINSFCIWVAGYAPRLLFTLALLVHAVNGWLFYLLLVRAGASPRLAYLAGAAFVLIPTAHGSLFWFLNNGFYRLPPLFLFLLLLSVLRSLERG